EKNIDHLSHLIEVDIKSVSKKFKASEGETGNLSGNQFPTKVWSLTFDNGPSKNSTGPILQNLIDKKIKATFFQLAGKAEQQLPISKSILDAGMGLGSHSYTHQELTRVGSATLDKEIKMAKLVLEESLQRKITFFRLP